MGSHHPKIPPAPQPTRVFFDPFNSSSTGHQRAESKLAGSTSWRQSRSYKLSHQFRDTTGGGGQKHLSDLVGAGSVNWKKDGRKENGDWEVGAPGLRETGWQDIRGLMTGSKKRSSGELDVAEVACEKKRRLSSITPAQDVTTQPQTGELVGEQKNDSQKSSRCSVSSLSVSGPNSIGQDSRDPVSTSVHDSVSAPVSDQESHHPQIFKDLTIYLNGSTAPLVSDHKLKQLFAQHGGVTALALGRRTVTHVILGNTCGGGLASGKLQKEVLRVRGKGVKYVTARWVLDSVERGIRQPEARYSQDEVRKRIGGSGQGSVLNVFGKKEGRTLPEADS